MNLDSREPDDEVDALARATADLYRENAQRRCIELIVKRAGDLSVEGRADFDSFVRRLDLPGFRKGRVPPSQLHVVARKDPHAERYIFRNLFHLWNEIFVGFPESVRETARQLAPDVNLATSEWSRIVQLLPALEQRTPRYTRQELLLALFTLRFGTMVGALPKETNGEVTTEERNDDSLAPPSVVPEPDSATEELATRFRNVLHDLDALEETSAVWDTAVLEFIDQLAHLRVAKLSARATATSRDELAGALSRIREETSGELSFLRLSERCEGWSLRDVSPERAQELLKQMLALERAIAAHRTARVAAQNAADDGELEAQTARRQAAKREVLELVVAIEPSLRLPASDVDPRENQPPSMVANTPPEPAPSTSSPDSANVSLVAEPGATHEGAAQVGPDESESHPVAGANAIDPTRERPAARLVDAAPVPPGATSGSSRSSAPPPPDETSLGEIPAELTSYMGFRHEYWVDAASEVVPSPWRSASFVDTLGRAAIHEISNGPARCWKLLVFLRAIEALGGAGPVAMADARAAAGLWVAPRSPSAGQDLARCERLRSGAISIGGQGLRVGLVLEAICPSTEASLPPHEIESLVTQAEFTSGTLRVVVGRLLAIHAQGQDAVDLIRRSNRVTPAPSRAVDDRLLDARKDLQLLMTRLWSAAGGRVQRTHCRRAWSEFVDLVQPTLARLCPAPRGDESWIVGDVQQAVDGYAALAESICEKYGAKFDDR